MFENEGLKVNFIAFQSFRKRWKTRLLEFAKSKTKENDGKCENRQKRYEGV